MEFPLEVIALLFFTAAIAGWVDVIAGGGGLLTIPVLVIAGLPPAAAVATNKVQASVGTLIAAAYFVRKGAVDLSRMKFAIGMTLIGSVAGGYLVLQIDANILLLLLPVLLIATGLYFLFSPNISDEMRKQKIPPLAFALAVAPLLGFYDGFFGPGTGSFMSLAFVLFCGYGLTRATANAKILNFTSNFSALVYFIFYGDIVWLAGVTMIAGQLFGTLIGAKMVIQKGAPLIKPIVVSVCFLMSISLLLKLTA